MVDFKKKGLAPLQAARTSAQGLASKVADVSLQFALAENPAVKDNALLKLYETELQKASGTLDKELDAVRVWLLKKGTSPTEAQATAWTAEFVNRTNDLKRHRDAFDAVTKHKVAELQQAMKTS